MRPEQIADYMRPPDQDIEPLFWLLGVLCLLAAGSVLARQWYERRHRHGDGESASFDPEEIIRDLARLGPGRARVVAAEHEAADRSDEGGVDMPFLQRDGELVVKKGRFYLGHPEGGEEGNARPLFGKDGVVEVRFKRLGVDYALQGRVYSVKRLSKRMQRAVALASPLRYEIAPIKPLQQHDQRQIIRHYLDGEAGAGIKPNPPLDLRLYLHRAEWRVPDGGEWPVEIEEIALKPYCGTYAWEDPAEGTGGLARVHRELKQAGGDPVWVSRFSEDGGLDPLGRMQVLGLEREKPGKGLLLKRQPGQEDGAGASLAAGDLLLLGYAVGDREKELIARVVRRRQGFCQLAVEAGPREQGGYPVRILEFGITGLRLAAGGELLDYLTPPEGDAEDPGTALENGIVVLDFYPEFHFPPAAREAVPSVAAKFQLMGRIVRGDVGEESQDGLELGLHFIYEPAAYDRATAFPAVWQRLHGYRESAVLREIHQSLERLRGILQADALPA